MFYVPERFIDTEDTVLIPIAMLSLFVLSALFMGLCFLYQPVQMYLNGTKREAADLVIKSAITFASITVLIFVTLLLYSRVG